MKNKFNHISVMLNEAIDGLNVKPKNKYIDATLGGGGHTEEILKRGGIVLGIDQDADAVKASSDRLALVIQQKKCVIAQGNFQNIAHIATSHEFNAVNGILMDLGLSSYQLDASGRGFSIRHDEELDMRMDMNEKFSAFEVVNKYSYDKLIEIFYRYGEEHNARKIAEAIVDQRKNHPIKTTKELAALIEKVPHRSEEIHPATRVFQAIRIEVNQELDVLKKALEESESLLRDGGRLVVISFHSLEDRIVKQSFERFKREGKGTVITKKPLIAAEKELAINRRARSAKLRIFEKIIYA